MKHKMRKSVGLLLACMMLLSVLLVACNKEEKSNSTAAQNTTAAAAEEKADDKAAQPEADGNKPTVTVTTSFLLDMTKVLAGDYVNIELIIPAGEDPHLYNALPEDKTKLSNADLVLYHGLHFEGKMVEILEKVGTNLSENFPEDKIGKMEEDGDVIIDPHFWFDVDLYKLATENAAKALQKLLPDKTAEIQANLDAYLVKLDELDKYNREQLEQIPQESRILITPHDAFNYFSRRYNIEVKAPQGVSTDSEVATGDVTETVNLIVDKKVKAIFAESTTDPKRMEKLQQDCANKGFEVKVVSGEGNELYSDSLAPEGQPGDNYIDMYKHNVDLIVSNLK